MRAVLVGAGKFGSMYLAQARRTPGVRILAVADLAPDRARAALARVGWEAARYAARSLAEAERDGTTFVLHHSDISSANWRQRSSSRL